MVSLTYADSTCRYTEYLEQPSFEDVLRSVVLCKLALGARQDV